MSKLAPRQTHGRLPELSDWLDMFDWVESPFTVLRQTAGQTIRVEDYLDEGTYIIRAELPDVEPDKDVEITVSNGILRIHAERHEEHKEGQRSEFRYGSFSRTLRLPKEVAAQDVKATYDKGVLTITVPIPKQEKAEAQRIAISKD